VNIEESMINDRKRRKREDGRSWKGVVMLNIKMK
jgi:hypothetical protein